MSNLALRSKANYHNPGVYGTISGDAFKSAPEVMRDGGINFNAPKKKDDKAAAKVDEPRKDAPKKDTTKKETAKKDTAASKLEKAVKPDPDEVEVRFTSMPRGSDADCEQASKASSSSKKVAEPKRRSRSPEKTTAKASTSAKKAGTSKLGPTSSDVREDDAAMAAMMGMEMDEEFNPDEDEAMGENGSTSAQPASVSIKQEAGERKRKRRIVKKSKMEMDEKGYMGESSVLIKSAISR